jgi:hypothetical protein
MAHAIMGNEAEARKIQFEFAGDMENFADNMPVVGHIKSGVHMAMGDEEKAKEVALSKLKFTVRTRLTNLSSNQGHSPQSFKWRITAALSTSFTKLCVLHNRKYP